MGPLCLQQEEILVWKVQRFSELYDKRVKNFWMWDMVQNVLKIIAKKLYVKESRNFIRENTETAVHGSSGIYWEENTRGGVLL